MPAAPPTLAELAGTEWIAESIDGRGVLDRVRSTLRFEAGGRVSGDTACNRFSGTLAGDGAAVRFGPLATTRRACPPAVMEQEQRYLQALGRARALRRDGDALVLTDDANGAVVRFARSEG